MGALVVVGSKATSSTGRLGRTALLSVTLTQTDWFEPVPRLRPIWTAPSLVPTTTTVWSFGSKASWLMKERLPSVPLVRLAGLLTYQVLVPVAPLKVSQTRT